MISMITSSFSSFGISDIFYLLIIFIILYVSRYYYHYFTRINPLHGPFPLPIVGNLHQRFGYEFNDWLMLLHKKFGDMFEISLAGQRMIILCNTDLIENMNIPSKKTKYPFRSLVTEGLREYRIGTTGILINNIDPKSWKYNRRFFTQAMMTPSFNNQAVEWANELWIEMESYWNELGENHELDLTKWMQRFSNEMIFKISTGVKNNCMDSYYYHTFVLESNDLDEKEKEKIKESENFIQSIETFMRGAFYFFYFNRFMRHYVPFIRGKVISLLKNRDFLDGKVYKIIKERRIEIENTPLDQPLRHDMLPMTDKEILGNILNAIGGGTDTVSNLFCFIIYHLVHHPEVVQRLRQEFDEVLGKDVSKPITQNDIDKLQYCDAVIKEVHRHFPVNYSLGRVNVEKDTVGGYIWPEKTSFSILYCAIMKRKDYWTDPEKFDPDRFYNIDDDDKYLLEKQHVKNAFAMFGGGIGACPGRKLTMIELKCLLTLIYRKYDIELADPNAPLNYSSTLLSVCKELLVKVKPRNF
ncbi:unnamed protein product [Rhizophagus irregularis]|nr:unnamed protein product [Rhizophagus irregularis]